MEDRLKVFKTKWFVRYAQRAKITDEMLCKAIEHAERGLIDADLGGNVIKQRIARPGQGQSKGYRSIIAYKHTSIELCFFMGLQRMSGKMSVMMNWNL